MVHELRMRRHVAASVAMLLLSACSPGPGTTGGGGGGGAGGGLTVSASAVEFATTYGDPLPEPSTLYVTVTAADVAYVAAGYPPGVTTPSWLHVNLTGSGTAWYLGLWVDELAVAGPYSTTLRVAITKLDGSVIGYRDVQVKYTVTAGLALTQSALTFRHSIGSSDGPPAQTLFVNGTPGLAFTVSADQPWVTVSADGAPTPSKLTVSVDPTALGSGTYPARIAVAGGPAPRLVDVMLTVAPPTLFVSPDSFAVSSATSGGPVLSAGTFQISLSTGTNAYPWTATGIPSWLDLSPTSGTISRNSIILAPRWDPTSVPSGTHTASVDFKADVNGLEVIHPVTFTFTVHPPAVTVSPSQIALGTMGHDLGHKVVNVSVATGVNGFPFTAVGDGLFSASPSWGNVSSTGVPLTISPTDAVSTLAAGTYTGAVTVTVDVNGVPVTKTIPVTLSLGDHELRVSADGVAFTSTPTLSSLTRTVRVRSNRGVAATWSARSDQPWLTVTEGGTTADGLVLTANPATLAQDALHLANVTVTSSDAGIANTETIRVGLWAGSSSPASPVTVSTSYIELATDPVRPYAYLHSGGTTVSVYHLYTGALTMIGGVGAKLGAMAVSTDGSRLFVVDDGSAGRRIVPVDLATRTVGTAWTVAAPAPVRVAYARANGVGVVLASDGSIRNAATGANYAGTGLAGRVLAASRDGSRACVLASTSISCAPLGADATGAPIVGAASSAYAESSANDVALSSDGTRAYLAPGPGHDAFRAFDASASGPGMPGLTNLVTGYTAPGAIDYGPDERIYGGSTSYSATDTWVFLPDGTVQGSYDLSAGGGLLDRQLAVSGDGLRVVVLTEDPTLKIVTAP